MPHADAQPEATPPGRPSPTAHRWWRGRYGGRLLREVAIIAALLVLYRLGRTFGRDQAGRAFANAREVLAVEDRLGIDTELSYQRAVLHHLGVVRMLNRYYASVHFPVSIAFLVFVYVRAPKLVANVRYLFVSVTAMALVIHLAYPLAPPRMLHGYVDTIAAYGPAIYEQSGVASVANQYAAMPSLHFGWAVLVAYGVVRALHTRWRWVIVFHPVMTLAAIVLTANHYWLDAVVALGLIVMADALAPAGSRWHAAHPEAAAEANLARTT
ncbi:MAG TPA: phosphatase PAP2 family protein [Acidimicrobiales bacterium]|nr:phosphatase PAP2 family protein [Acidimicrobiales bacterium]